MRIEDARHLIEAIESSSSYITGIELKLLEDIKDAVDKGYVLSPDQSNELQIIYRFTQNNRGYQKRKYI